MKAQALKLILVFPGLLVAFYASAQDEIAKAIENKAFVFEVQSVSPQRGQTRQITPGYTLTIDGDSLESELPYFGRVYQADIGDTDGGLSFTATAPEYKVKERKKGGWVITIKAKEGINQHQFNLIVSKTGTTTLNVTSTDRESISYYGTLRPKETIR